MSGRDRLHRLVWLNQVEELRKSLSDPAIGEDDIRAELNSLDVRGNTPLHLACKLGNLECVKVLLEFDASTSVRNAEGWFPLSEARSTGNREIMKEIINKSKQQMAQYFYDRGPNFVKQLADLDDFYLEMRWDLSSWVPLLTKLCPNDTYKIWKKGSCLRVDTTLVGFENLKWIRGHVSFLFLPTTDDKGRVGAFYIVDQQKGVYEEITADDTDPQKTEEYINMLMNTHIRQGKIIDQDKVSFIPNKGGILGLGMKSEIVGEFPSEIYTIQGLKFKTMTRMEHLSPDAAKQDDLVVYLSEDHKPEELESKIQAMTIGKSEADVENFIKDTRQRTLKYRPSLPPPKLNVSFEDYFYPELVQKPSTPLKSPSSSFASLVGFSKESSEKQIPEIEVGRNKKLTESIRQFKANVWMSNSFPLFVEQLLPIFEIMAPSNEHFGTLKEFIDMKLPRGFPVKIEMPLFGVFTACVTFQNYRIDHNIDENLFVVNKSFQKGEVHFNFGGEK